VSVVPVHLRCKRQGVSWAGHRGLRVAGLDATQAANLTARLVGLRAAKTGWSLREIEGLLFIRSLVESGRLHS